MDFHGVGYRLLGHCSGFWVALSSEFDSNWLARSRLGRLLTGADGGKGRLPGFGCIGSLIGTRDGTSGYSSMVCARRVLLLFI
jgi:hypothetical protein